MTKREARRRLARPRLAPRCRKTWMPGTSPGMTEERTKRRGSRARRCGGHDRDATAVVTEAVVTRRARVRHLPTEMPTGGSSRQMSTFPLGICGTRMSTRQRFVYPMPMSTAGPGSGHGSRPGRTRRPCPAVMPGLVPLLSGLDFRDGSCADGREECRAGQASSGTPLPSVVMPGLVPGIHVLRHRGASRARARRRRDVDARNKSGHDEKGVDAGRGRTRGWPVRVRP